MLNVVLSSIFNSIQLPSMTSEGVHCLSFAYHMYGHHVKALYAHVRNADGSRSNIFEERLEKGNTWLLASLEVTLNSGDKIEFTGERGNAYSGDIGLDLIQLNPGGCS